MIKVQGHAPLTRDIFAFCIFFLFYIFISRIDSYIILEMPSEWSRDAKSALLYVSGEAVATIYLANKTC